MNPFEKTFSKQAEKIEAEKTYTISPMLQAATEEALKNVAEKRVSFHAYNKTPQRYSKRIVLGKQEDIIPLICPETGAVMGLLNPAIPGKGLVYRSPLATFAVARDMASEGPAYLNRLDMNVLAAIAITLAAEYDIFRYSGSVTGAQKNALLRTIPKDMLINGILILAGKINAINYPYLPSLSVIIETEIAQEDMRVRFVNWLTSLHAILVKPITTIREEEDQEQEEKEKKPVKLITPQTDSKTRKQKADIKREYKAWRSSSKDDITAMYKAQKISMKLRNFLMATIAEEETLMTADATLIDLMAQKLEQLNIEMASKLAIGLKKFHRIYVEYKDNEFTFESTNFASTKPGLYIEDKKEEEEEFPTSILLTAKALKEAEGNKQPTLSSQQASASTSSSNSKEAPTTGLSIVAQIRARKAAAIVASSTIETSAPSNQSGEQDATF